MKSKPIEKRRIIDKLPGVLQTDTLKKFFNAGPDHLFQKDKIEKLSGYIGRTPYYNNFSSDFYINEINKDRQNYQLEPSMVSEVSDEIVSYLNYYDFINQLNSQGVNTNNHSRLFDTKYYSWAPPIDIDKVLNYSNYYWYPEMPPVIGIMADAVNQINVTTDILGKTTYTSPNGVKFSSGMRITFTGSNITPSSYLNNEYIVEGVGKNIILVDVDIMDTSINPLEVDNNQPEYITIARGADDQNPWSRTNHWYHKDIIQLVVTGTSDPISTEEPSPWDSENWDIDPWDGTVTNLSSPIALSEDRRAKRPIVEFIRNLELYNYGTKSRNAVDLIDLVHDDVFTQIEGQIANSVSIDGEIPANNTRILVVNDKNPLVNNRVYIIKIVEVTPGNFEMNLILETDGANIDGSPATDEKILIKDGTKAGIEYSFNGTNWVESQRKVKNNQAPLFNLYDSNGNYLGDQNLFPNNNFTGNKIFNYKINESPTAPIDKDLGFAVFYKSLGQISDIIFENNIVIDRYSYLNESQEEIAINGFYYYKKYESTDNAPEYYNNAWHIAENKTKQKLYRYFQITEETNNLTLDYVPTYVEVYINNSRVVFSESFNPIENDVVRFEENLKINDFVEIFGSTNNNDYVGNSYYEIPLNLQANPDNLEVTEITRSEFLKHFVEIISYQPGFSGKPLSFNNYKDISNDLSLGKQIVQHHAPLLKTMLLASDKSLDVMDSIRYIENEYHRFRNKIVNRLTEFVSKGYDVSVPAYNWLDDAIAMINQSKNKEFPFYYNRTLPTGSVFDETIILAINGQTIFNAPKPYDPNSTLNDMLLVYVNDNLKTIGLDYNVSNGIVTFTVALALNDKVRLRYYENIIESYMPPSAAMLGITPVYLPERYTDNTYANSKNVIQCHDGSIHIEFGDIRDDIILELEKRIYNTIKPKFKRDRQIYFDILENLPGKFRKTDYTIQEINQIKTPLFTNWATVNQLQWKKNNTVDLTNWKTWNYTNVLDQTYEPMFGSWRAIYRYYYDTDRPHTHPWEMLGFSEKPSWWVSQYGAAPYTSSNTAMWNDLETGTIKQGPRQGIWKKYARPGLSNIKPVDGSGNLKSPFQAGILLNEPDAIQKAQDWNIGDFSPIETAWYRSDKVSFINSQIAYLIKPNQFIDLNWDNDVIKYAEIDKTQILFSDNNDRPNNIELKIHGELDNNVPLIKMGVQQWISEYLRSQNKDITQNFGDKIRGLEVNLSYKIGGFVKRDGLRFISNSYTPGSKNLLNRVFLQDKDIDTTLYTSPPIKTMFYGGVIVENSGTGYKIYGYDVLDPNFNTIPRLVTGRKIAINVADITVEEMLDKGDDVVKIPYGTTFNSRQQVYDFLVSYGDWLEKNGWKFDSYDSTSNEVLNWRWSGKEFLFWSSDDLDIGAFISLSPAANGVKFATEHGFIDNIENIIEGTYSILSREGMPIDPYKTNVVRYDNEINISPEDELGIFAVRLNVKEIENIIIFENETEFGDIVYQPLYNSRQYRLKSNGYKTPDWNGRLDAPGYIIDNDTRKDLVPNFEKLVNDFTKFYNIENSIETSEIKNFARHNFGYQKREYLDDLLIDEDVQFEFYQGFIKQKGSKNAFDKLLRSTAITSVENLDIFEEWAIRLGEYGNIDSKKSLEILLKQSDVKNDPQLINFVNGFTFDKPTDNVISILPNDNRWIFKPDILKEDKFIGRDKTKKYNKDLPNAGFAKVDEVKYFIFNIDDIFTTDVDQPIINAALGEVVWIANEQFSWNIRKLKDTTATVKVVSAGGTGEPTTFTTNKPHLLTNGDIVVIKNIEGSNIELTGTYKIYDVTTTTFKVDIETEEPTTVDGNLWYWKSMKFVTTPSSTLFDYGDIIYVTQDTNGWAVKKNIISSWETIREQPILVDNNNIMNSVIYNNANNRIQRIGHVFDPFKGFINPVADSELAYKLEYDPAQYTNGPDDNVVEHDDSAWGNEQVGDLWWDLSTVRYVWYEQDSIDYRYANWGSKFPGSSIDVYEWVKSPVSPDSWNTYVEQKRNQFDFEFSGEVKDVNSPKYVMREEFDTTINDTKIVYYFWVKNKTSVPTIDSRRVASIDVARYIDNPDNSGISWCAAIEPNAFLIFGVSDVLDDKNTVLQINYEKGKNDVPVHYQWDLIRESDPTSFIDDRHWNKMKDSLVGFDNTGKEVPDLDLNEAARFGHLYRPRQTWFKNREEARRVFITEVNKVLKEIDVVDTLVNWDEYLNKADTLEFNITEIQGTTPNPTVAADSIITINNIPVTFTGGAAASIINDINNTTGIPVEATIVNIGTNQFIKLTNLNGGSITILNQTQDDLPNPVVAIGFTVSNIPGTLPDYTVANLSERTTLEGNIPTNSTVFVTNDETVRGYWTYWQYLGGTTWELIKNQDSKTTDYWTYIDWYAPGYNADTKIKKIFATISDRNQHTPADGEIVKVNNDGSNKWSLYIYKDSAWNTIGKEDRTIELSTSLYTSNELNTGFDGYGLDDQLFDNSVQKEFRNIVDAIRFNLFVQQYRNEQNKLFFKLVNYVHTEQNVVDWIFKTSYIHINGYTDDLGPLPTLRNDNFNSIESYINEIKPYHVKIRSFLRKYKTPADQADFIVTDFDKPPYVENNQTRILDPDNATDQLIMQSERPWIYWAENYVPNPIGYSIIYTSNGTATDYDLPTAGKGNYSAYWLKYENVTLDEDPNINGDENVVSTFKTRQKLRRVYDYNIENNKLKLLTALPAGAKLLIIANPDPVRKNKTTIKFDRISNFDDVKLLGINATNDDILTGAALRLEQNYEPTDGMVSKKDSLKCGYKGTHLQSTPLLFSPYWDGAPWEYVGWDVTDEDLVADLYDTLLSGGSIIKGRMRSYIGAAATNTFPLPTTGSTWRIYVNAVGSNTPTLLVAGTDYINPPVTNIVLINSGQPWLNGSGNLNNGYILTIVDATLTNFGAAPSANPNIVVRSNALLDPHWYGYPEELLPLNIVDTLVLTVTTRNDNPPSGAGTIYKYRIFYGWDAGNNLVFDEYIRFGDSGMTTLSADLDSTDTQILVTDVSKLPDASVEQPGTIWINNERIQYLTRDVGTNSLSNLIRETKCTTRSTQHEAGARVYSGSDAYIIPLAKYKNWQKGTDPLDRLHTVNTTQAQFIRLDPGS